MYLGRSNGLKPLQEMGHHYFTRINFATEPLTPIAVGGRAMLMVWQGCLLSRYSLCPNPPHVKKLEAGCAETGTE